MCMGKYIKESFIMDIVHDFGTHFLRNDTEIRKDAEIEPHEAYSLFCREPYGRVIVLAYTRESAIKNAKRIVEVGLEKWDEENSQHDIERKVREEMEYPITKLELDSDEAVRILLYHGYEIRSPLTISFKNEVCRVAIMYNGNPDHVVMKRSADTLLHIDVESVSLQYLYVDQNNPRQ